MTVINSEEWLADVRREKLVMAANHRSENSPNRSPIPRKMNVKQAQNFFYDGILVLRSGCKEGFVPDSPDSAISVWPNPENRVRIPLYRIGYVGFGILGPSPTNPVSGICKSVIY